MKRSIRVVAAFAAVVCALAGAAAARADAPANVFDGAGVFVDDPLNFPGPWGLAAELQANHFTWVAFHVTDGLYQRSLDPMWVQVFHDAGIEVGGWGWADGHPLIDAVLAHLAVQQYGLDFYIADAEAAYEATHKGFGRSKIFVGEFRQLEPTLPAALVTYGAAPAPWVLPIDYASWRNAGFDLLPEAYYNQSHIYRPDLTLAHALRAGWPADRVHPVVGVYHHYPASKYVPMLQQAGTTGFSVFLGDQATSADYAALAPLAAGTK